MGHWRVTIEGHGTHHNGISTDAEAICAQAVTALRAAGHSITRADLDLVTAYRPEYGSGENVEELTARLAKPAPVVEPPLTSDQVSPLTSDQLRPELGTVQQQEGAS